MRQNAFLEKFGLFADTPDAVEKIRGLLNHFAVIGKLVPNRPDEVAVGLKLRGQLNGDSNLPANWRTGLLGEVFNFEYGDNLPAPKRTQSGEYPVYGSNGIVGTHDCYLTKEPAIIVGRKGSAGALNVATGPSWTTDVAYFVRPPKDLDLRFTYYLFATLRLDELGKGIKPGLSRKEVYALPIAVPPLAEQKRIVAKVDELMALCDRLALQQQEREKRHAALTRASRARFAEAPTPANLSFLFHPSYSISPADLRQSILTLAVLGKLVPQCPHDLPAEEMLRQISSEKKQLSDSGNLKADKKAWVNSSANPPYDVPGSWCWVRLQDVFEISRGGSPRPAGDPRFFGGSIPWITVGEVTKDSEKYLTGTTSGLTEEGSKRSRFIKPGDLLLTNSGATLGVPKISKIRGCMNDGVAVLRLFHSFELNDFGYLYLTHQTEAFRNVNQGMGQPNLNTPIIAGWYFPLPPLAEQRRIVAKVDQLMALVDQLEAQLTASRATTTKLLDAIVAELTAA